MEEVSTAERVVKPREGPGAKPAEGPKSPGRRRLLKAAGALLAAEIGASAGLAAYPTVEKGLKDLGFMSQPNSAEIPTPNPVDPDKPAAEKAINKVPLAELTQKMGRVGIMDFGKTSARTPYAASLFFGDLTIVDIEKNPDSTIWVALAMPGDKLSRQSMGTSLVNFDGSKTEQYTYKGFTSWILINNTILVVKDATNKAFQGLAELEPNLKIGNSISFNANLNQLKPNYQQMNVDSFNLLSTNIGKSNSDRSDQTFKFVADIASINVLQK